MNWLILVILSFLLQIENFRDVTSHAVITSDINNDMLLQKPFLNSSKVLFSNNTKSLDVATLSALEMSTCSQKNEPRTSHTCLRHFLALLTALVMSDEVATSVIDFPVLPFLPVSMGRIQSWQIKSECYVSISVKIWNSELAYVGTLHKFLGGSLSLLK